MDDFNYNGTDSMYQLDLSSVYPDRSGNPRYLVETTARLHFEEESRAIGKDVLITVAQNQLDLAMEASNDNDVLSLLKFKASDRNTDGYNWQVEMDVDVKFLANRSMLLRPYQGPIKDMMVIDDYLSFTINKMEMTEGFTPTVTITRVKALRSDEVIFESQLSEKDWVLTEFGRDRSLITIDIAKHLTQVERGKKHIVSVKIGPVFGKWRPFTKGSRDLLNSLPTAKVETNFRYSDR